MKENECEIHEARIFITALKGVLSETIVIPRENEPTTHQALGDTFRERGDFRPSRRNRSRH